MISQESTFSHSKVLDVYISNFKAGQKPGLFSSVQTFLSSSKDELVHLTNSSNKTYDNSWLFERLFSRISYLHFNLFVQYLLQNNSSEQVM